MDTKVTPTLLALLLASCAPTPSPDAAAEADALNQQGLTHFQATRYPRAAKLFLDARDLDPTEGEYANNAGMAYLRMGQVGPAATHFQNAIELNPERAMYHYNIGLAFLNGADPELALAAFLKAIEIDKDYFDANSYAGLLFFQSGAFDDAVKHWENAAAIKDNADIETNLAMAYMAQGDEAAALEALGKAKSINPDYGLTYYNYGVLYQKRGDLNEAEANYAKAAQLAPEKFETYLNLAIVQTKLEKKNAAIGNLETFLTRVPANMTQQINDAQRRLRELRAK
ncbi:MAG: tetratricopeptide repeat protein [bacterium]|nr:tetratricopeptide repeat protein [bacterium]